MPNFSEIVTEFYEILTKKFIYCFYFDLNVESERKSVKKNGTKNQTLLLGMISQTPFRYVCSAQCEVAIDSNANKNIEIYL